MNPHDATHDAWRAMQRGTRMRCDAEPCAAHDPPNQLYP
ncbi:hypothetical protein BSLA_01f4274 [Burkholderia stabilis]|nr:hypothetical protein BSLA_01f4274 [Burkholderia stabilis]